MSTTFITEGSVICIAFILFDSKILFAHVFDVGKFDEFAKAEEALGIL